MKKILYILSVIFLACSCNWLEITPENAIDEDDLFTTGYGFRNALITLITLFAGLLPSLVAGSVIVEYVFNIPGMGNLSLLALSSRDYPLQMALFFITGTLTLTGIFIADILYGLADPRIKLH